MPDIAEFIGKWLHEGQCKNETGRDIRICIDGKPSILHPGETSPKSVDCDGIIHSDGSATKIHGATGIQEHKDRDWVRSNWPDCVSTGSRGTRHSRGD